MLSCSQDPWMIHQTQKRQLAFQDTFQRPLCVHPSMILQMRYVYQQFVVKPFEQDN